MWRLKRLNPWTGFSESHISGKHIRSRRKTNCNAFFVNKWLSFTVFLQKNMVSVILQQFRSDFCPDRPFKDLLSVHMPRHLTWQRKSFFKGFPQQVFRHSDEEIDLMGLRGRCICEFMNKNYFKVALNEASYIRIRPPSQWQHQIVKFKIGR